MARTTRKTLPSNRYSEDKEKLDKKQSRGQAPRTRIEMKNGKRVGPLVVGGGKGAADRDAKKLAKRRRSKRERQAGHLITDEHMGVFRRLLDEKIEGITKRVLDHWPAMPSTLIHLKELKEVRDSLGKKS